MSESLFNVPFWYATKLHREKVIPDGFVVRLEDLESWTGRFIRDEGEIELPAEGSAFQPGDVLFGKLRPYLAKYWYAVTSGAAIGDIHVYRPNEKVVIPRFLFHLVSSSYFVENVNSVSTGTKMPRSEWQSFRSLPIFLPPLDEQHRIADFLDEETGEIDRVVGVLDELIEDLDVRRSNTIREKMDEARELTIESGIATIPDLGYEAVLIRRGISPAYLEDGDEEPGSSIRVVNQKCIRSGSRIDYSLARRNDLSKKAVNKDLLIRPGDILINSTGTGTLGRTALVREVDEPTTFDSHVTLVRPKSSVDGGFLGYFMLNSEDILVLESRGSTNQIELSQNTVSWLELPLPSLDEQRRIADYLDEETSRIDNTKATATELREELIARRKAIITEYVTGQKRVG